MTTKHLLRRPPKELLWLVLPRTVLAILAIALIYKLADPAPPNHLVISTGDGEGDYATYAKRYQEILKEDGIDLEIRNSSGSAENLRRLQDAKSDVVAGFVHDGLGSSDDAPDLVSLGSLYYEPIWVFYRGSRELGRLSQLQGKRIALGPKGSGTRELAEHLLQKSGINSANSKFLDQAWEEARAALARGEADVAFFIATPEEPLIRKMLSEKNLRLMSMDQAEAMTRHDPFLHHLILPHGSIDIKEDVPAQDVHLLAPTATLLVKDSLHPALMYLLLKAAGQVHSDPGILEKKDEFPIDKDYQFPLADEAKHFYKSGVPFWQRHLPLWLAILVDRFVLLVLPAIAILLPLVRAVPKFLEWRVKSRIYSRYGELKFLETQIKPGSSGNQVSEFLEKLDKIEERVHQMKVPIDYTDHVYELRGHIDFVRDRLLRTQPKIPG